LKGLTWRIQIGDEKHRDIQMGNRKWKIKAIRECDRYRNIAK
jgi:hypothetical protein